MLSYLWLHWLDGLPDTHLSGLVDWLVGWLDGWLNQRHYKCRISGCTGWTDYLTHLTTLVGWLVKPETLQVSYLWLHWLNGLPDTHLTALVGWLVGRLVGWTRDTTLAVVYLWLHWLNGLPDTHLTALVGRFLVKPDTTGVVVSLVALVERTTWHTPDSFGWLVKSDTTLAVVYLWLHWLNGLSNTHLTALLGWLVG